MEALTRWKAAAKAVEKYGVSSNVGTAYAVICLSIDHAAQHLGEREGQTQSQDYSLRANEICRSGHCWIRGMGTYWLEFLGGKS